MTLIFSSIRAYKLQLQKWSFTKYNTTRLRRDEANNPQQDCPSTSHDNRTRNMENAIRHIDNASSNSDDVISDTFNAKNIYNSTNVSSDQFLDPWVERFANSIFPPRSFHRCWQLGPDRCPTFTSPLARGFFETEDTYAMYAKGQTELHIAIQTLMDSRATHISIDTVNQLLKAGVSPRRVDLMGDTPLHLAVRGIESDVGLSLILATFLKNNHRCLRFPNATGVTVFSNLWDRARTSPSRYHALNFPALDTDIEGDTQLEDMQENSRCVAIFKIFITVSKAVMLSGASPIIYVDLTRQVSDERRDLEEVFSALGQNHNQENGSRILHFLALKGVSAKIDVELAQLLLLRGADINSQDRNGETPLMKALRYRRCDPEIAPLALFLVENGADLGARDFDGNCAIWDAYRAFAVRAPETFLSLAHMYAMNAHDMALEIPKSMLMGRLQPMQEWNRSEVKTTWDQVSKCFPFHMQPRFKSPRPLMSILKWLAQELEGLVVDNPELAPLGHGNMHARMYSWVFSELDIKLAELGHVHELHSLQPGMETSTPR